MGGQFMPQGKRSLEVTLVGDSIHLEPLGHRHAAGLITAAAADPSLYAWTAVPQGEAAVAAYIETALAWRAAGTAAAFAIVRTADCAIIGSTRFWNIESWNWPQDHVLHETSAIDVCEIGYTWLTASAIRTAANTQCKRLMLSHAFEDWKALRVCFHTDARNQRSAAALKRIGASYEGTLRAHRLAADMVVRDSLRFSIVVEEWPAIRQRLDQRQAAGISGVWL
jgi:RimJ/RimL family protein N-acetyltransferase